MLVQINYLTKLYELIKTSFFLLMKTSKKYPMIRSIN